MTDGTLWYWIASELKALGLKCIAYGPEFWLGIVAICAFIALELLVLYLICK